MAIDPSLNEEELNKIPGLVLPEEENTVDKGVVLPEQEIPSGVVMPEEAEDSPSFLGTAIKTAFNINPFFMSSSLGTPPATRPADPDKVKKKEDKRKSDPIWQEQSIVAEDYIEDWLSNDDNIKNVIGDTDINWGFIYKKDEDTDSYDMYQDILKEAKKSYINSELSSVNTAITHVDIDDMIKSTIKTYGQNKIDQDDKLKSQEYDNMIIENDLSDAAVDKLMTDKSYNKLTKEEKDLHNAWQALKNFPKPTTQEESMELKRLEKNYEDARLKVDNWWNGTNQLMTYDGSTIDKITKDKDGDTGFQMTQEEYESILDNIANGDFDPSDPITYADNVENLWNKNNRDLWYQGQKGKQVMGVTINDASAWHMLHKMGYAPTGKNNNGFEYNLPIELMTKHYKTLVEGASGSDDLVGGAKVGLIRDNDKELGYFNRYLNMDPQELKNLMGGPKAGSSVGYESKFKSKDGHFGLTGNWKDQKFDKYSLWHLVPFFGPSSEEGEFAEDDKSRNFKIFLRNFRDEQKEIVQQRAVLRDMHLLNIDPTKKRDNFGAKVIDDFVIRGAESVTEALNMESTQWLGTDIKDPNWSNRREKDVLQGLSDYYGLELTDNQKEELRRGTAMKTWEGLTGFVPAIAEFALIDVAAKKTGILTGIPKLATKGYRAFRGAGVSAKSSRAIANTMYHTGKVLYEEGKMMTAFDEYYHMGGGAAFYGVGKILPKFIKTNSSMLDTFVNGYGRSGVAGTLSVQAAQNLEAIIRDVAGNEEYMSYIKEQYFNEDGEFKLADTAQQGLVDFLVFSSLNVKQLANKDGRLALRPTNDIKVAGQTWIKGLTTLKLESGKTLKKIDRKLQYIDGLLKTEKVTFNTTDGVKTRKELETRQEELVKEAEKYLDIFAGVTRRINTIGEHADWADDQKATDMLNKSAKNVKEIIDPNLEIIASKKVPGWVQDKEAAAEYNKDLNRIYVNTSKTSPGKLPHEVIHIAMRSVFDKNPDLARKFKEQLSPIFDKLPGFDFQVIDAQGRKVYKTGTLEEFIEANYTNKNKAIKNEEYLAYAVELLANPNNYSKLVSNNVFGKAYVGLKNELDKRGIKNFEVESKEDLVKFLYGFTQSIKSGSLNQRQLDKLRDLENSKLFKEPLLADNRTNQTKVETSTDFAFNSKELVNKSNDIQKLFEQKFEETKNIESTIKSMIAPTPGNPTSVAGVFDNIVYGTIDAYNRGRVAKGFNDLQVLDPTERYMLATELVYNLSRAEGTKARGLEGIIRDYKNRPDFEHTMRDDNGKVIGKEFGLWDKNGNKRLNEVDIAGLEKQYGANKNSELFKQQAIADGYKPKQNLTKTVMQMLALRIHALKGGSLDAGIRDRQLYTVSLDDPNVRTEALELADTRSSGTGNFKLNDNLPETKGKMVMEELGIKDIKIDSEINSKILDLYESLPIERVTYGNFVEGMKGTSSEMIEKSQGVNKNTPPKEYVEKMDPFVRAKEKELHESLPKTSNEDLYEPTNINKSIFKPIYKNTGEKFKSIELPQWLTKKTNARTTKFEKQEYKEGQITDLVLTGRDAGVVKKKIQTMLDYIGGVADLQLARQKLNDAGVQEIIKNKDLSKFHALKTDNIINYIKQSMRGATPENFQSKDLKVLDKWIGKWKQTDFSKYKDIGYALDDSYRSMTNAEQKVLDKYWPTITGDLGYKVSKNVIKEIQSRGQNLRKLNQLTEKAIAPKIYTNRFKGINEDIKQTLKDLGLTEQDLKGLTIDKTIGDRVKNNEKYFEFVNELMDKIDPRLKSLIIKSYGDGKYKFNGKNYESVSSKVTSKGKSEKLPFNPEHVKLVDNGKFKASYQQELIKELLKPGYFTKARKLAFAEYIRNKYLVPKVTKKDLKAGKKQPTYDQVVKANQAMQKYIWGKLFDYVKGSTDKINAINNVQQFLQFQTSIGGGFSRGGATHTTVTLRKPTEKGLYSEHEFQVINMNGNGLISLLKNQGNKAKFLESLDPMLSQFKQSVIRKELQTTIDSKESGSNVDHVYRKGYNTDLSSKANFMVNKITLETTLDLATGKTWAELIADANKAGKVLDNSVGIRKGLEKRMKGFVSQSKVLSDGEIMQKLGEIDIALGKSRSRKQPRKGISVFDFDDTVARTKSLIDVTMPDGKKFKIDATEFAKRSEALEKEGAKFGFEDFNKVVEGQPGPLMPKIKKAVEKFGNENVYILTARPQLAAGPIQKFLKGLGVDIKLKNITGLEDGRPEAKALWILEKASKGYNDFYFVDDAYKNVKAVNDVLDVVDVKSKVRQAYQSLDLSKDINDMIERKFNIGSEKTYSIAKARLIGKKSGKVQAIASSAQDFQGLWYRLLGKGKQGDLDKKFFEDNLSKPFAIANNNISIDKMRMINDFNKMKKDLVATGIPKNLKASTNIGWSREDIVRIYTWNKQGFEVPGLSKKDLREIVDFVETKEPQLVGFSQKLIDLGLGDGYIKPKENWNAGTITTDLLSGLHDVRRAKYLEQSGWTENIETIFSKENLNKMEAALGTNWRNNMEKIISRMKTGRNRQFGSGSKLENMALDWVNNSVGVIMFLNTRSALLQTISSINYINWHDNNPLQAGKAFANQKQYWKDYVDLFTSDFMVERRGGNKINIAESEIADAADRGGVKSVISYLLDKGFVLTRAADSHAIASGGATFYRNRINTYKKQGLTETEAKKKAFNDFREITEESQQSSRVDRISNQQASNLGRLVLAFANTPSQYARLMQKAASDLQNGRGDWRENMSKIAYYGAVQNFMFNAMQNAIFKDAFDDNDKIDTDYERVANGMASSILRGMGWQGAAIDTFKNWLLSIRRQSKKKRPKYADTATTLLDISPPIDSKISKVRSGLLTLDYNMDEIQEKGFSLDNPAYMSGAQIISSLFNIPMDRAIRKYNNISAAIDEDTETWQSIALLLGYGEWELGMLDKDQIEEIKTLDELIKSNKFKIAPGNSLDEAIKRLKSKENK